MSRPTPPAYKTRNWPAYNKALKRRGSLTIWFDPAMNWDAAPTGKPFGGVLAGPMRQEKGLLVAEIDVAVASASRRKFDVSGHYARPDVFTLHVNRAKQTPIAFD